MNEELLGFRCPACDRTHYVPGGEPDVPDVCPWCRSPGPTPTGRLGKGGRERRAARRLKVEEASVRHRDRMHRLEDLSEGGAAFEAPAPMEPGAVIEVELGIPGREELIPATAEVRRVRRQPFGDRVTVSVEFLYLPRAGHQAIRHLFRSGKHRRAS